MRKIVLTFGLIAGAIMSAMLILTIPFKERMDFDTGMIVGYTSMVMAFLMIYFGVRSYRDNVAGGVVSFGRALMVGGAIMAVATVCYVATWEVLFFRSPEASQEFMTQYEEMTRKKGLAAGKSPAQIDAEVAEVRKFGEQYKNPLVNIAYTILEPLPVGLLFALGSAWALSRKRRVAGAVPA